MSRTLLHLSDLHAGKMQLRDEDAKQKIPQAERLKLLERLADYVKALARVPDYVAITGDLTIASDPLGLEEVLLWLSQGIAEGYLPDASRIIVTPGNHDVVWGVDNRYRRFFDVFGKGFAHAYLPDCDPPLQPPVLDLSHTNSGILGGIKTAQHLGQLRLVSADPFILDLDSDVLLFAFNSTLGCGVSLNPDPAIEDVLKGLEVTRTGDTALSQALAGVRSAYARSRLIDAGMVGKEQLAYFAATMRRIRSGLGKRYLQLTKIALLHHHISHLWRQQLELKSFEAVVDAAQLKQYLTEFGFDLVLHGHKHANHVSLDSTVVPISEKKRLGPLCIITGGTVGGNPRLSDSQTFKVLELVGDRGPRVTATVSEVPLLDAADPARAIADESRVYQVPISSRLPELHDLHRLKHRLDDHLVSVRAPELAAGGQGGTVAQSYSLPVQNGALVGKSGGYKFCRMTQTADGCSFYEVILATSGLTFRTRARVYWMLNEVRAFAAQGNGQCRVVLILGNLEGTHFSPPDGSAHVRAGITQLRRTFAPAIKSGLLEIREHRFTQEEIDEVNQKALVATEGKAHGA